MALPNERLIMVATPDEVQQGELFVDDLPPHMTIERWHQMTDQRLPFLKNAMSNLFAEKDLFQNTVGGKRALLGRDNDVPVRLMRNVETTEQWAMTQFIKSMSGFDPEDPFSETFTPHVTDSESLRVRRGQAIAFRSIVLFATGGMYEDVRIAIESYPLRRRDG